jgi:hypothetical protein
MPGPHLAWYIVDARNTLCVSALEEFRVCVGVQCLRPPHALIRGSVIPLGDWLD